MSQAPALNRRVPSAYTLLRIAIWFAIVTGVVEGALLLLFQRLNWARWGPMLHVSWPILWIAPVVDVILFVVMALMVVTLQRLWRPLPATRVLLFLLVLAAAYDWLTATGRLFHWSSFLLALGAAAAAVRWLAKHEEVAINFWNKTVPWFVVAVILVFAAVEGGSRLSEKRALAALPPAAPSSPNVLVIVVDTLRADHLSSYGYARSTSPTIDRMGREGALFENAISTCSWSFPSHVSLVTGRYQFEHGMGAVPRMPAFGKAVPSFHGYLTLGQALEHRGYRTAAFSANRTYFSHDLGFWQGVIHFEDYFHSPADAFVRTLYGREFSRIYLSRTDHSKPKRLLRWLGMESILDADEEGSGSFGGAQGVRKRATEVNRELLNWIGEAGNQHPFFAMINYFDVHAPYGGPRSFVKPDWPQSNPVDLYDDSVRYVDDAIGELMLDLKNRGLAGNTLVVITSDHGESLGLHGLESHGAALYRELIHVPLIFWFPGQIPAGQRISQEVSNAAIPTTVMALVAQKSEDAFPRPSLSHLWSGSVSPGLPDPISELAQDKYLSKQAKPIAADIPTARTGSMESLVSGRWHLIIHSVSGTQLYDWGGDPEETRNLASSPEGKNTVLQLTEKMKEMMVNSRNQGTSARMQTAQRGKSDSRF